MTTPASKEFRREFEPKAERSSCFGFLKGRKVKKKDDEYFAPLCRSPRTDDLIKMANFISIRGE